MEIPKHLTQEKKIATQSELDLKFSTRSCKVWPEGIYIFEIRKAPIYII